MLYKHKNNQLFVGFSYGAFDDPNNEQGRI